MATHRRGSHVTSSEDTVGRSCDFCEWEGIADSYPALIEQYQDHLRENHPKAWLRDR